MKSILFAIIATVMVLTRPSGLQAQSTVSTPIVGFEKKSFPGGTTGLGLGFVKPAVYSGQATSLSSNSVTTTGASFGSLGLANGLPTHYVEITSGGLAGYVADIVSNTGTTLSLNANLSPILGTSPNYTIRPHTKISDVFKDNTTLSDYVDTATVYNSNGSVTSLLRDSSAVTGWVNPDSFAAADFVIYPGQAVVLSVSGSGNVTVSGQVKTTPTIIPLYASSLNFVSIGNPSANPSLQNSGLGTSMTDFVDTVANLSNDGSFSQTAVYLWGGATDGFINPDSFAPVSGVTMPGTGAVLVSVSADTTWVAPAPVSP